MWNWGIWCSCDLHEPGYIPTLAKWLWDVLEVDVESGSAIGWWCEPWHCQWEAMKRAGRLIEMINLHVVNEWVWTSIRLSGVSISVWCLWIQNLFEWLNHSKCMLSWFHKTKEGVPRGLDANQPFEWVFRGLGVLCEWSLELSLETMEDASASCPKKFFVCFRVEAVVKEEHLL